MVAVSHLMYNPYQHIYDSLPPEKRYIQISPQQAMALAELVRIEQPRLILEIGTGAGYSTTALASGMNAEARLISIEKDYTHYNLAQQNLVALPFASQITLMHGDAKQLLQELAQEMKQFDFVFIDANKRSYPYYLYFCRQYMRPNGVLVADNVHKFAGYDEGNNAEVLPARLHKMVQAVREFYNGLQTDAQFEILPAPKGCDFIMARRKS